MMKGYRNRMCKLLASEGAWHLRGAERRPRGLELIKEGRAQVKSKLEPEGLVGTWLLFLMPRKATGEFQMEKDHKWMLSLGVARMLVRT